MQTSVERTKIIAGATLIGLGILFCYDNLHQAATQLRHALTFAAGTVGIVPATLLVTFRFFQAYASDHHRFLQAAFWQIVATFWPLLLIIAGAVLSPDCSVYDRSRGPKKD
jgi:hypothetical protein